MDLIAKLINKISPQSAPAAAPAAITISESSSSQVVTKDAVTGVMVALFPAKGVAQTIYDFCVDNAGLPAEIVTPAGMLHIILAYLGNTLELAEQNRMSPREVADILEYRFSRYELPLVGKTTGIALFDPVVITDDITGLTEKKRPLVLLFDSSQLPEFRHELAECLEDACGLKLENTHGFMPHITLCYLPEDATIPDAFYGFPQQAMLFTGATLAWGAARFELPLLGQSKPNVLTNEMMTAARTMEMEADNYDMAYPHYKSHMVIKEQANGEWRFFIFTSSAFEDKDKEWVEEKALLEDCAVCDLSGDYGPLLWWHEPKLIMGQVDMNEMRSSILIESGLFKSPLVAKAVQTLEPELGISMGFKGWRRTADKMAFVKSRKTERSALPQNVASNRLTAIAVINKAVTPNEEEVKKSMAEKLNVMYTALVAKGWRADLAKSVLDEIAGDADALEKSAAASGLVKKEAGATEPTTADPAGTTVVNNNPTGGLSFETVKGILTEFSTMMLENIGNMVDAKLIEQATKETALATTVSEANKATNESLVTIKATVDGLASRLAALEGEQPASVAKQILGQLNFGNGRASQSNANLVTNSADIERLKAGQLSPEEQLANSHPSYRMAADMVKSLQGYQG